MKFADLPLKFYPCKEKTTYEEGHKELVSLERGITEEILVYYMPPIYGRTYNREPKVDGIPIKNFLKCFLDLMKD